MKKLISLISLLSLSFTLSTYAQSYHPQSIGDQGGNGVPLDGDQGGNGLNPSCSYEEIVVELENLDGLSTVERISVDDCIRSLAQELRSRYPFLRQYSDDVLVIKYAILNGYYD